MAFHVGHVVAVGGYQTAKDENGRAIGFHGTYAVVDNDRALEAGGHIIAEGALGTLFASIPEAQHNGELEAIQLARKHIGEMTAAAEPYPRGAWRNG